MRSAPDVWETFRPGFRLSVIVRMVGRRVPNGKEAFGQAFRRGRETSGDPRRTEATCAERCQVGRVIGFRLARP